jgi:hypothetical protein
LGLTVEGIQFGEALLECSRGRVLQVKPRNAAALFGKHFTTLQKGIAGRGQNVGVDPLIVPVQREMESGSASLGSIAPIPPGQFAPPKPVAAGGRAATETDTGFKKKSGCLVPFITARARNRKTNWLQKNIDYARR